MPGILSRNNVSFELKKKLITYEWRERLIALSRKLYKGCANFCFRIRKRSDLNSYGFRKVLNKNRDM